MAVIKTFNPPGRFGQIKHLLQFGQSLAASRFFITLFLQFPVQNQLRIMLYQFQQPLFFTNLGRKQINPAAALLVQPIVERIHIGQRLAQTDFRRNKINTAIILTNKC